MIPPCRDQFAENVRQLLERPIIIETKHRRADGTVFDVEINCRAIELDGKRYLFASSRDITERKLLDLKLRKINTELEQFAYVASHDLRQPLRMVSSYLTLIEQRLGSDIDDELKEFLGFAVDGAKRMDRLILDLLEYSRTGKVGDVAPVALADAVEFALRNLSISIQEAEAEITVAEDLPIVAGDLNEMTRLFQNLLSNAIKYRAPGRPPKIDIGCCRQGSEWLISVKDNGIGIATKDYDRAFGIFQRLVSREAYEGSGIGLAVCRKIVEHYGGHIWIESGEGEGSTFLVSLPIMNPKKEPPK